MFILSKLLSHCNIFILGIKHDKLCSDPNCEEPEIYGMLWKCEQCPDVTLCSSCYHSDKHDIIHKFTRFDYSGHQGSV